jgi:hypothetical protein
MSSQIQLQIEQALLKRMLAVPLGRTREDTAAAVIRMLRPYLKKPAQHSLTSMMVEALFKFRLAVRTLGRNDIHIRKEMYDVRGECPYHLTYDQLNNWSKLRFFGLSVHANEKNKRSGHWLLTHRGGAFLRGEIPVARKVWTFAGHPIEVPESSLLVRIEDYKSQLPEYETYQDFKPAPKAAPQLTLV